MGAGSDIRAGAAYVELLLKDANFQKRLDQAGQRLTKFGAALTAATVGPLAGAAATFASVGDAIQKMAKRTGFSAQSLSELKFAAQQSGTTIEAIEKSIRGMTRGILDAERGMSTAIDNLADLGLTLDDLKGKGPEEQFQIFAERLSRVDDQSRRAALAMKVFGRSGADMLPLLENGVAGMNQLREEARQLGITLSDDDANAAAELTDAMGRLKEQTKALVVQFGAAIAGPMTEFAESLKGILRTSIDFVTRNREMVVTVAKAAAGVGALGAALVTLGGSLQLAALGLGGIKAALLFITGNPVTVGLGLVAAAFSAIAFEALRTRDAIDGIDAALQKLNRGQTDRDPAELQALVTRFEQLAARTRLTTAEQEEARKIIQELRQEYGDLVAGVESGTGRITKAEKTLAQIRAAQGGQSQLSLKLQIGLAELAITALKAEGAELEEIIRREKELANLRERLARTERIVRDANPLGSAAPNVPAVDTAKQEGERAGEAWGQAFIDIVRTKTSQGASFVSQAVRLAAGGLDALQNFTPPTPDQLKSEVFATFSSAAAEARGRGAGQQAQNITRAIERAEERQARRDNRLLDTVRNGGVLRA
ncbi:MAG: hypothetical protein KDA57_19510 [Planctomycetales bacterium]|nr:hypothetical protein [Planctomycetales bacterium]